MLDEKTLKERLQEIAADNFKAPTRPEIYPLILAMGTHIGSVDAELRDDLIYTTMATWIKRGIFEPTDLNEILKVILNEQHLFFGLGEKDTDSVFTRSFSMLLLAAVLQEHRRHSFLPYDELLVIKKKLLRYIHGEKDFRGYVHGKGWAHSVAHTADTIGQLVQCPEFDQGDIEELLLALQRLISNPAAVYIFEEDERLVTAVLSAWKTIGLENEYNRTWLRSLLPTDEARLPLPEGYFRYVNKKGFLRSLYFRTLGTGLPQPLQATNSEILAAFNRFDEP